MVESSTLLWLAMELTGVGLCLSLTVHEKVCVVVSSPSSAVTVTL